MVIYQLLTLLFKTIFSGLSLIGRSEETKLKVKQRWGQAIVDTLGFKVSVKGQFLNNDKYILVGNHISFLDIPVIMSVVPEAVFIAKSEIRKWPIIGPAAAAAGTIFVDRENRKNSRALKEKINEALQNSNKRIVIFPAGTTTLQEERPWKKGIFRLAQENDITIKAFSLSYEPVRESAYVDGDNLLAQIAGLSKIKTKRVCLTWLSSSLTQGSQIHQAESFAEEMRQVVRQSLNFGSTNSTI